MGSLKFFAHHQQPGRLGASMPRAARAPLNHGSRCRQRHPASPLHHPLPHPLPHPPTLSTPRQQQQTLRLQIRFNFQQHPTRLRATIYIDTYNSHVWSPPNWLCLPAQTWRVGGRASRAAASPHLSPRQVRSPRHVQAESLEDRRTTAFASLRLQGGHRFWLQVIARPSRVRVSLGFSISTMGIQKNLDSTTKVHHRSHVLPWELLALRLASIAIERTYWCLEGMGV